MVKKNSFIRTLCAYDIPWFVFAAIVIYFAEPTILLFFCKISQVSEYGNLYPLIRLMLPISLAISWLLCLLSHIKNKHYAAVTGGRSYSKDAAKYKRSYGDLIDYFKDADPYRIPPEDLPTLSWETAEGVILGKLGSKLIHVPSGKDGKNYMIFGLPASGKTAGPIICTCLRFGLHHPASKDNHQTDGSVFCIDIKGDIYKATHDYRKIKCLNLTDPQKSCHFDPLAGIDKLTLDARCNYIENLGYNIIPPASGSDGKYFRDTAQDFWSGIALYMLDKDIHYSFPDIIKAVLEGNAVSWVKQVVADGPIESRQRLASKWGENEKNLSGGYSLLAQSCRNFASETLLDLLDNNSNAAYISVQDLEDGCDVYLQVDQADLQNYAPLLSMIVQIFLTGLLSRDSNMHAGRSADGSLRPIAMILDEFAQLSTLSYETVAAAYMTLRSRNVSIIAALQSRSSIAEMFQSENACNALIDCVSTFAFLSIQEVTTRKWASDLIGTKKVLKISNNLSLKNGGSNAGKSVTEAREPIIYPEEFGNLKDPSTGKDQIIIYSQGKYIRGEKQYYFN